MNKKRLSACIALIATFSNLATTVSAANWNLDAGNISINHNGTTQTVTQNGATTEDNDIVITQSDPTVATSNTVKVSTTDDGTAKFTLSNVNISNASESLIDVGSSAAEITLDGENYLEQYNHSDSALIHVNDGSLTIKGNGSLNLNADTEGALIGSNNYENMSGNITVTDHANISAQETADGDGDGAGIGSGDYGDFTGSVTINGNAEIDIDVSSDGAGIGSGMYGVNSGDIVIEGNADVDLWVDDDGAGIGAGDEADFDGTITIGGNAVVKAVSDDQGTGIGAGEDGTFNGTVTIKDNAKVYAESGDDAAGIGSGEHCDFNGTVTIKDNAFVETLSEDEGAGIGAGQEGDFNGTISIEGNAEVHAESDSNGAGIGAGEYGSFDGTVTIGDNAQVYAESCYTNAIGSGIDGNFTGDVTIKDNSYVFLSSGYADIGGCSSNDDYEFNSDGTVNILDKSSVVSNYDTLYLGYFDYSYELIDNDISVKISDQASINGYAADQLDNSIAYMDYSNFEIVNNTEESHETEAETATYMAPANSSVKFTITDTSTGKTYNVDANNIARVLAKVTDGAEITLDAENTRLVLNTDIVNEIIENGLTLKINTSKGTFVVNADNLAVVKTINLASIIKTAEFKALDKEADTFNVIITENKKVVIEKA
ncbi:MAG: hypothetical protein J6A05_02765 [Oscillospiraceae bacterium]|nr:hypothetical protein [Oscillospiraceae bacterium]